MNVVLKIAEAKGRDYITPEDITEAFEQFPEDQVRLDTLEQLGLKNAWDRSCCAFVAWKGKQSPTPPKAKK